MKIIEKLSDMMEEEMHDAEKYIECALRWKEEDVLLGKMYYDLSMDELKHATMLHENGIRLINEYKQKGNEVPEKMQAVYDYLHQKHVERFNKIKMQQSLYKA